jgi:cellulose synthase/poly-beta-1,6-N-acetylglucosamine synthase-like glycosyltransferase
VGRLAALSNRAGPAERGRLDYDNARHNWLTRCFTLEYASWFHLILPLLQRIGWPIPLGAPPSSFVAQYWRSSTDGTPHNVTEDADLGLRLARAGT